ncbi:MAG TPA: hypothetical protein VE988_19680, partial [Gemmataceae bacterium]|nr:hypothetical protein [Gemmataceae bacterium]
MKLFRLVTFVFVSVGILAMTAGEGAGTSAEATAMWDDQGPGADLTSDLAGGLPFRCVGPALTSGRISAITIDPRDSKVWYVCAAAGGMWKTSDGGTSFKCMTDNIGSFCMGSVALDPKNPDIVWLGTGEQQSQRSVDFGDGIYKSMDGGKTWKNMGLVTSEHIARIRIDPRNTDVVYVASVGPLWNGGGERGVYKTTDGGKTWKASLTISENTGVVDLVIDSQNPDNLYAAAFQRRRHTGCCISGGPESGIYRTHDGGTTWTKITKGIPTSNMGRIALEISPQNTNTVYAQISAMQGSGFYRSDDKGVTWAQTSTGGGGANMYYGDIYADPHK